MYVFIEIVRVYFEIIIVKNLSDFSLSIVYINRHDFSIQGIMHPSLLLYLPDEFGRLMEIYNFIMSELRSFLRSRICP